MFGNRTPDKWKVQSSFYPCTIETDKYGSEKQIYPQLPTTTISVAWQSLDSGTEQAEYGGRLNEHLQAVLFNCEHEELEIKSKDKFVIRNSSYEVCAIEYLPSYRLVTVERVR